MQEPKEFHPEPRKRNSDCGSGNENPATTPSTQEGGLKSITDPPETVDYPASSVGDHHMATTLVPVDSESGVSVAPTVDDFGDYQLLEEIARGGMGIVYKARHKRLNRTVALKMILAGQLAGREEVQRFRAEAEAAANLEHPGIVPVYEVGEHGGRHFFSMGFVEGTTLAHLVAEKPLDGMEAARLIAAVSDAIAYANERGVVHRDLKPGNVLLDADGHPRVTDFGLAKQTGADSGLTATGQVLGTPSFMAPEQASGKSEDIGPAADIYALGATLYCLLTGRPPFHSANPMDTLLAVIHQEPVPPRQLNPAVSRDLETICLKCLRKEIPARYETAGELAAELRRYTEGRPIEARPISSTVRLWRWCRRNPITSSLVALVCTLLIAGTVVALYLAGQWKDAADFAQGESFRANSNAADFEQQRNIARDERDAAKAARTAADSARAQAERRVAELRLERGQQLCEEGEIARGLLWIARGMASVPKESDDLERVVRRTFNAQLPKCNVLQTIIQQGGRYPKCLTVDCKLCAVIEDDDKSTVRLWDLNQRVPVGESFPHEGAVTAAVFSPDEKWLYTTMGIAGKVLKWNLKTGEVDRTIVMDGQIGPVALHPDGSELALANGEQVYRFDVRNGELIDDSINREKLVQALQYSPNGQKLAVGGDDKLAQIYDLKSGEPVGPEMTHSGTVTAFAFSNNGKLLATGAVDGVRVWEPSSAVPRWHFKKATPIFCLAFDGDDRRLAGGGFDQEARIWSVATGETIGQPMKHGFSVSAVSFDHQDRALVSASFFQIRRWKIASEQNGVEIYRTKDRPAFIAKSAERKFIAVAAGNAVVILKDRGDKPSEVVKTLKHRHEVLAVSFSPDGSRLITHGAENRAVLWDVETWKPAGIGVSLPHVARTYARFNRAGDRLFTRPGMQSAQLWDPKTGQPVGPRIQHGADINFANFSPDGVTLLTAGGSQQVRIWNAATGIEIADGPRFEHGIQPSVFDFSPDKKMLLLSGFHQVNLANAESGEVVHKFDHQGFHTSVRYSPDGKSFLTTGRNSVAKLWNAETYEPIGPPIVLPSMVRSLEYTPDSQLVSLLCDDGRLRIIDVPTARLLGWSPRTTERISRFILSDDGKAMLTIDGTGSVRRRPLPLPFSGAPSEAKLIAEVSTGLTMNEDGAVAELYLASWSEHREQLGLSNDPIDPVVLNTSDTGNGSLRQAVEVANAFPGHDKIRFNIPGDGPHTISLKTPLRLEDGATIDATSQPGFAGIPQIEIEGANFDANHNAGIVVAANNCHFRGLCLNRFPRSAIALAATSGSSIEGCFLGTDPTGLKPRPNGRVSHAPAIAMWGSSTGNRVGSDGDGMDDEAERNLISGNRGNAVAFGTNVSGHVVRGNFIGTDVTGKHPLLNTGPGFGFPKGGSGVLVVDNTIMLRKGRPIFRGEGEPMRINENQVSFHTLAR